MFAKKPQIQLRFRPTKEGKDGDVINVNITINVGFYHAIRTEANGMFSVYVPGFNISFTTSNREEIPSICGSGVVSLVKSYTIGDGSTVKSTKDIAQLLRFLKSRGFASANEDIESIIRHKRYYDIVMSCPKWHIPNEFTDSVVAYGNIEMAA